MEIVSFITKISPQYHICGSNRKQSLFIRSILSKTNRHRLVTFSEQTANAKSHISYPVSQSHSLYICMVIFTIMTSIESIVVPVRLFSIFNISLRALDVLFIALSNAILRDSIRQSYWNACIRVSSVGRREGTPLY